MSSMSLPRPARSVAFRMTLLYALLFGILAASGLTMLYLVVAAYTEQAIDMGMQAKAMELYPVVLRGDIAEIQALFSTDVAAHGHNDGFYRLLSRTGQVLAHSDVSSWPPLDAIRLSFTNAATPALQTVLLQGPERPRSARVLSMRAGGGRFLQLGVNLDDRDRLLLLFRGTASIIGLVMLTVAILVGRRIGVQAMSGVRRVTRAAERMANGQFSERMPTPGGGAEIDLLADAFNRMADRIALLIAEMRQVNDNIAHDLRSPITRIRGLAEMAITTQRSAAHDPAETIGSIVEECDRMLNLINTMLDISEAEVGIGRSNLEEFDLGAEVHRAAELFQLVAEEKSIVLTPAIAQNVIVRADRRKIQRLLSNLLDNALKYTVEGEVAVALSAGQRDARLSVRDTGVGIAADEVDRVFERFYRCDSSRNQPGNGLGLSLARAIVHAHGGKIAVTSSPGHGSEFTVVLPLCAADAADRHPPPGAGNQG